MTKNNICERCAKANGAELKRGINAQCFYSYCDVCGESAVLTNAQYWKHDTNFNLLNYQKSHELIPYNKVKLKSKPRPKPNTMVNNASQEASGPSS